VTRGEIHDLLLEHTSDYIWCDEVADAVWAKVARWVGDAQASEHKIGYDAGYAKGFEDAAEEFY
jgi:hypothetical protein